MNWCGKWRSVWSGDKLSTVRPTLGLRTAEDKTISQLILLRLESQKHNFWCYLRLCRTFYHQRRPHTVLAPSVEVFDLLPLTFRSIIVSPMTSHLPSARWHATRRRLTDRSRDENSKRIRQKYNSASVAYQTNYTVSQKKQDTKLLPHNFFKY